MSRRLALHGFWFLIAETYLDPTHRGASDGDQTQESPGENHLGGIELVRGVASAD
jgi:hypothetical protein